jgi:hypothetical protein
MSYCRRPSPLKRPPSQLRKAEKQAGTGELVIE